MDLRADWRHRRVSTTDYYDVRHKSNHHNLFADFPLLSLGFFLNASQSFARFLTAVGEWPVGGEYEAIDHDSKIEIAVRA